MGRTEINLTARVFLEEGVIHAHLIEIGQMMQLKNLERLNEVLDLAVDYFEACKTRQGLFERKMAQFGIDLDDLNPITKLPDIRVTLHVEIGEQQPQEPMELWYGRRIASSETLTQ